MRINNGNKFKSFSLFSYYPRIQISQGAPFLAFHRHFKGKYLKNRIVTKNFMRYTHREDNAKSLQLLNLKEILK